MHIILGLLDLFQLLMRGQKYRILLDLEMPESPTNQNLGEPYFTFYINVQNIVSDICT